MTWTERIGGLLKSPAAVYLGAAVLARTASFFLIPLYTRRVSLQEYGDYALFLTIVTFLSTFLSSGLVAAVPKFYFSVPDKKEGKARAAEVARWVAIFCLGFGGLLVLGVWFIAPEEGTNLLGRWSLSLAVAGGAGMAIGAVPWTLLRSEQRAYAAASFQLIQFFAMTGAGLLLVAYFDRGYRGVIEAAAGAQIFSGAISLVYIAMLPRGKMSVSGLKRALAFSVPFVPHFVAQWLQGASDRWILKGAGYEAELGGYSLASQVVTPVNMVVLAWNDSVGPRMGELYRAGGLDNMRAHLKRVRLSYLAAVGGPGILITLAIPVVALLVGEEFRSALIFTPFLVVALIPDAMYYTDFQIVYYAGRTKVLATATVTAAAANIVLNLLLVPFFGAWGAVVARFASGSVRAGIIHWAARTARDTDEAPTTDEVR